MGGCLHFDFPSNYYTVEQPAADIKALGWTVPALDEHMTQADVVAAIPTHSLWYSFQHGTISSGTPPTLTGFQCWNSAVAYDWSTLAFGPAKVATANVPVSDYKLVFLNGCYTGDGSTTMNDMMNAFHAECYVGWQGDVQSGIGCGAADTFLKALKGAAFVDTATTEVNNQFDTGSLNSYVTPFTDYGSGKITTVIDIKNVAPGH